MRVVYLGNQDIGVRCLQELVDSGHDVAAVFVPPPGYWERISGARREPVWYASVEEAARHAGLPVHSPRDISAPEMVALIRSLRPDVLFSISWDQMVCRDILAVPPAGCFNLHFGLLPENRGHAPVNWAVMRGYTRTGVTMHAMTDQPDAGDIVGQRTVEIRFEDTARDVYLRLLEAAPALFREVVAAIAERRLIRTPQAPALATYGPRRRPADGLIDWSRPAYDLYNFIRALTHPYPGAFTFLQERKLFIWTARLYEHAHKAGEPGRLVPTLGHDGVRVAAGVGSVLLCRVQLEGDDETEAGALLVSGRLAAGERLGATPSSFPILTGDVAL